MSTGLDNQIGFKSEVTPGTGVTPDQFLPLLTETLKYDEARVSSDATFAGEKVLRNDMRNGGRVTVNGNVGFELYNVGLDTLIKHIFGGSPTTTGSDPYTHVYTPGALTGAMTVQYGLSQQGSVQPYTVTGAMVDSAQFSLQEGEIATLGLDLIGMDRVRSTALASASYPSGLLPFKWHHGNVNVDGSDVPVKKVVVDVKNHLKADRRFIGSKTISQPQVMDRREITGTLSVEFDGDTYEDLATSQALTAIVVALDNGTESVTLEMNAQFDWPSPQVNKRDIIDVDVPFVCLRDTADADALTLTTVNSTNAVA